MKYPVFTFMNIKFHLKFLSHAGRNPPLGLRSTALSVLQISY